jgi:hypothetical protein
MNSVLQISQASANSEAFDVNYSNSRKHVWCSNWNKQLMDPFLTHICQTMPLLGNYISDPGLLV